MLSTRSYKRHPSKEALVPLLDRVVRTEPEMLVPLLTTDDVLTRLLLSYSLNDPDDPPDVVATVLADVIVDGAASLIGAAVGAPEGGP